MRQAAAMAEIPTVDALPEPWPGLLGAFADYERAVRGMGPQTLRNHALYLRTFAHHWSTTHGATSPLTASVDDISAFVQAEADRGIAPATRRSQLGALRSFYDWLVQRGVASSNPARTVPLPRLPPAQMRIYRPDEVEKILAHTATLADTRGRQRHAMIATLRYTGMRSREIRTLRRDELELTAGRARVQSKAGRNRAVLLPAVLCELLATFLREVRPDLPTSPLVFANAHPFVTTAEHGFGQEGLAREVELAGDGAGVAGRHHPHRWRHTFATELLRSGVDVHVVQRLLGHISIASTVGYTHLTLDDLATTVDGLF